MKKIRAWSLCGLLCVVSPLRAGVTVGLDVPTLNELLPAMTVQEVVVPIAGGNSLRVLLEDLVVVGFAPAAASGGTDHILTSVTLRVPSLGVAVAVQPRMSLAVIEEGGQSLLELRFDEVGIPLPLAGAIDAAPFLTPLRFPADDVFLVEGARGGVEVRSRLSRVEMGAKVVRFEFELDVADSGKRPAAASAGGE